MKSLRPQYAISPNKTVQTLPLAAPPRSLVASCAIRFDTQTLLCVVDGKMLYPAMCPSQRSVDILPLCDTGEVSTANYLREFAEIRNVNRRRASRPEVVSAIGNNARPVDVHVGMVKPTVDPQCLMPAFIARVRKTNSF